MTLKPYLFTKQSNSVAQLNLLYIFYKKVWTAAFAELNMGHSKIANDYFRFDLKLGVFHGFEPVAFHAYQFFNLNYISDREHSYFNQFEFPLADELFKRDIKKIATMEYLGVDENYRKINGNNLGPIVTFFATQYLIQQDIDAIVTITRNNRSVNKLCVSMGGEALFTDLPLNNTTVDIFVFRPGQVLLHTDPAIQSQVDDFLNQVGAETQKIKKAA